MWVTSYEYEKMMINRNRTFLNGKKCCGNKKCVLYSMTLKGLLNDDHTLKSMNMRSELLHS